jgi:hypothetical protein
MSPPRVDGLLGGHSHFDQQRGGPLAHGKLFGAQLLDQQCRFGTVFQMVFGVGRSKFNFGRPRLGSMVGLSIGQN